MNRRLVSARACVALLALGAAGLAQDKIPPEPGSRGPTPEQLRAAQWVEGRVMAPEGTPADERLTVVADATGLPAFGQHEAVVGVDGRFRVAFAADARRGRMVVQGRYLFLDPEVGWKGDDPKGERVLKPVLGGLLRGRIVLPERSQPQEREQIVGAGLVLEGTPRAPGRANARRDARIRPDLSFEVPALSDAYEWTATLVAGPFVPLVVPALDIAPGKVLDVDWRMVRGAILRGRVVDAQGQPVTGAALGLVLHDDPLAPAPSDTETVRTGRDGAFEIRGIAAGGVTLWAELKGWISADIEIPALHQGEVREGVTVLLRAGHLLTGRVLDPDGRPVEGARVRITQSQVGRVDDVHELVTRADGAFDVRGLGDERLDVLATHESTGAGGAARKRWLRALARQVDPSAGQLVLTLVAGLVIEGRVHDDLGRAVLAYTIIARRAVTEGGDAPAPEPAAGFRQLPVRTSDGTFVLDGLDRGTWDVWAEGRGIVRSQAQRIHVPHEGGALLFIVSRPAIVAGTVLDAQKKPVADTLVEVRWKVAVPNGAAVDAWVSVTCGRDGRFEMTDAPPGPARVTARHEDGRVSTPLELELESGGRKDGIELVLQPGAPR